MLIQLRRHAFLEKCTIGVLSINSTNAGIYTLEPKVRPTKIFGHTAIPLGTYRVMITFSPHFNKPMPQLMNVPDFENVRIHPGNTDLNTEGCILVGRDWQGGDFIGDSDKCFYGDLFPKIQQALVGGDCAVEVS